MLRLLLVTLRRRWFAAWKTRPSGHYLLFSFLPIHALSVSLHLYESLSPKRSTLHFNHALLLNRRHFSN